MNDRDFLTSTQIEAAARKLAKEMVLAQIDTKLGKYEFVYLSKKAADEIRFIFELIVAREQALRRVIEGADRIIVKGLAAEAERIENEEKQQEHRKGAQNPRRKKRRLERLK